MPRLIDADKVAEAIEWLIEYDFVIWNEVQKCIDKVPTVDVVPVVRCKDCKYADWWGPKGREVLDCTHLYVPHVTPEWYCSWGERREDGNNDRN